LLSVFTITTGKTPHQFQTRINQQDEVLADLADLKNVFPHQFRHSFATMYLVRHPGDETGLRGALGHLSDDIFRSYTHIASEIIAQRAGSVSLSEAWLSEDDGSVRSDYRALEPPVCGRKTPQRSGYSLVHVVQTAEHWP
jgi:hypothetical protein